MTQINESDIIKGKILNDELTIRGYIVGPAAQITGTVTENNTEASTIKKGIIRIATEEEAIEGLSNNTAITPKTLKLVTTYVHEQGTASNEWVIQHNLNKYPSITVVDSAGNQIEGKETYIDENTVKVEFNSVFKGRAHLN